ncbi:MAG: SAM-dependent methyltransferase, partial [Planctomycetaceae bacterium]|nr:SAM-dependent methyltransferase [Planctomycetaceae bacterium]
MSDPAVTRLIQRCQIKPETIQQIEAWQQRTPETERSDTTLPSARELDALLSIPVPPKYKSSDMISTGGAKYWKLRGKLDVPKERWISFPHCEGTDGTLMLAWAGYDHLQVARAISGHYIDVRDNIGGSDDARLVPLLAGILELLPWLHQWHSEIDPEFNLRMNEYYQSFVTTGASDVGLSREEITAW